MPYKRPASATRLTKVQKLDLLTRYFDHYRRVAEQNPDALNVKVPRDTYADLLDQVGDLLIVNSATVSSQAGPVRAFLDANRLPDPLNGLLPDDFRAFCLGLSALKQWVSAEQAATDRFLLGGTARQLCRDAATTCAITGVSLADQAVELHHPVRDGRPSIPVSKVGHSRIEGQSLGHDADPHLERLRALKRKGNRSWVQLRIGCRALRDLPVATISSAVLASSKTFARKASDQTGMTYQQIIKWLDANGF